MPDFDPDPNCRGLPDNWEEMDHVDQLLYGYRFDGHDHRKFESPPCSSCPTCGRRHDYDTSWYEHEGRQGAWRCWACGTMHPEIAGLRARIEKLTKERDEARKQAYDLRVYLCEQTSMDDPADYWPLPWERGDDG